MKENIFYLPQSEPMQYDTLLCVGLCNKCKYIEMQVILDIGVDEPIDSVPVCTKKNFEVTPVPKGEEVTECEYYEPYI